MTLAGYNLQDNVYIYSNNKCMCVFLISPVPIAEPLTSELIDTPVFYNLAPRPIKYRVSVPIPMHNYVKFTSCDMIQRSVKQPPRADVSSEKAMTKSVARKADSALPASKCIFLCHTVWKGNILLSTEALQVYSNHQHASETTVNEGSLLGPNNNAYVNFKYKALMGFILFSPSF